MADHTAAKIFGAIFRHLGKERNGPGSDLDLDNFAEWLWDLHQKIGDFSTEQMNCDKELVALGLAKMVPNPDDPDDHSVFAYKGEDY